MPSLILLILSLPFGIGLQSLALFASFLIILTRERKHIGDVFTRIGKAERRSAALLMLVILLQIVATLLNTKNPEGDVLSFALGFLPLIVIPAVHTLLPALTKEQMNQLERLGAFVMGFWALVVVSQHMWGWKISGVSIVQGPSYFRSQGFYSHPLTLAYVGLMLFPFHLVRFTQAPRDWQRGVSLVSNLALLYFSASRTAQAVTLLLTFAYILWSFRGKVRLLIVGTMAAVMILVLATPNMISQRFLRMGSQISEEKESAFADDRIAFWMVHANMVIERPILGHGINLDRKYRLPYYEAIGLKDFKKAYEAHNQILQLAAEGGIPCALAFLAWLVSLHANFQANPKWVRRIRDLTIIGLFLGGLTQNAYFDGEVRYALILLMIFGFESLKPKEPLETAAPAVSG